MSCLPRRQLAPLVPFLVVLLAPCTPAANPQWQPVSSSTGPLSLLSQGQQPACRVAADFFGDAMFNSLMNPYCDHAPRVDLLLSPRADRMASPRMLQPKVLSAV